MRKGLRRVHNSIVSAEKVRGVVVLLIKEQKEKCGR
jgi:hypothetical protein